MKKIVSLLAATCLSILSTAALSQETEGTLVIRTTGGFFEQQLKKHFFDPFTKATGIKVIPVGVSYGEMLAKSKAMIQANRVEWDIISPQYDEVSTLKDIVQDLGDCADMPNVNSMGIPGTCNRFGVLYLVGGRPLAFDPAAFPNAKPNSWADFWDVKKFPGRRAMPNDGGPWNELVAALLADGVPADKLFPLDLDRAFKKLDEIKPHVQVWWKTGDQSQQLMRSKEVSLNIMFSGRAYASAERGDSVAWTFNQAVADWGAWAILKNAPHPKAAKAFINFYMANPEAHAAFSREMGYATPNKAGQALLSPEMREKVAATPEAMQRFVHIDPNWLAENRSAVIERWNKWISQ